MRVEKTKYLTRDGPVPLRDTVGVDVAGVGEAVAAAELRLAALHLISGETGLAAAAVVGALCSNKDIWCPFFDSKCKSTKMFIFAVLPQSCDTVSLLCSLRCLVLCIRRCRRRPE